MERRKKLAGAALVGSGILVWYLLRGKSASTTTEASKTISRLPSPPPGQCVVSSSEFDAFVQKDTNAIMRCWNNAGGQGPYREVAQSECFNDPNFPGFFTCFDPQFPSEDESLIPDKQEELFGLTIISV